MFRPNVTALLYRRLDRRTAFGKAIYDPAVQIPMAIVNLGATVEDSSVRADSSASRGAADVTVLSAKLLILPTVAIKKGDVLEYGGELIEITGIRRRNDVAGRHDHNEIIGVMKAEL